MEALVWPEEGLVDTLRREFPALNLRWNILQQRFCVVHRPGVHSWDARNVEPFGPAEGRGLIIVISFVGDSYRYLQQNKQALVEAVRDSFRGEGYAAEQADRERAKARVDAEVERTPEEAAIDAELAENEYYGARAKHAPFIKPKNGWELGGAAAS